jgi:rhamnosyltransferase
MNNFAIVIPIYNGGALFREVLISVAAQNIKGTLLVVDSGSQDGSKELAFEASTGVITISSNNFNHGGTRQMMVEQNPTYDFYIYLTQDAVLANQDSISNIMRPFHDPKVGAVCGRQLPHPDANILARHARIFNYPNKSSVKSIQDAPELGLKTAFLSNSFAAYRSEALKDVGGFPDNVIFGEDMYVAAKMLQKGWKVAYAADAECQHSHNYKLADEFRRYFDNGVFHAREPWIREMLGGAGGEGVRYVISELRFLGWKHIYLWPSSIIRNAAKYISFKLGLIEKYLPRNLKNTLSMNKNYWLK